MANADDHGKRNDKKENPHKNHRQKVKERYLASGMACMPDHNILEMLLFFGIPQRDTNIIAHELIEKFGSFSAVFHAKKKDLMTVSGMTENAACLITMILPLYQRYVEDVQKKKICLKDTKAQADFLHPLYLDTNNERIYLLCLDSNYRLLACRLISEGDFSSAAFDIRKIASVVLEVNANKVVLSHNHPNSACEPSDADEKVTKAAYALLDMLKVQLVDHIIITETDYFSMLKSINYTHIFYGIDPIDNEYDE